MATVLFIEDDSRLVRGLRDAFEHHGFRVLAAADGQTGLEAALGGPADLIILDLMLPRLGGVEVCRRLRAAGVRTPVIMLTVCSAETDRIEGLEAGADDYVTKPFSVRELIARAHAALRRIELDHGGLDRAKVGAAQVDFKRYELIRSGEVHPLTDREVAVLRLLLASPGEVVRRDRLLDEIWGYDGSVNSRTLDTFMYRLRHKLEDDPEHPRFLLTVRSAGYRLIP